MNRSVKSFLALFIIASFLASGCGASNTVKGGGIGAAAGGVIGGVIGSKTGSTAVGAIIGAAVGGAAGALIGNYMDRQAEEMRKDLEGARVERVGEGIKITFPSGILFATNKYDLQPAAKDDIQRLAKILKKYADTNVLIEGHTDSDGSDAYNQTLSEKRASSVASFAEQLGVATSRITTKGYGESQPVATNDSPEGKQANRRVEVAVFANDKLKKAAENGKLPPVKG
ncbi:MAG: OmpA family protein [Ignavibacteria bacterium]|jgi:outer membrane protein OmpA-like peptidoglycan-associated protein|nr:OmpA family protein [Ignavibacteria bacterium]MCU7498417.1 OmpA family protein [Ignavibacteria bacterium]MCU7520008.1 OmpA family protein [Ignavibacteria bacterium]HEX2963100.1 OmpA family protein [Ignavibacteriales bacterium]